MKESKDGREFKSLPKNFEGVKREFQKLLNIFLSRGQVLVAKGEYEWDKDIYEIPTEQYALLWVLMQELEAYFNVQEGHIIEKLLEKMGDKKEVILRDYNLKVTFDPTADWFFKSELTRDDWRKLDKEDNKKFLEERNKK